jgi:hypothetical protein
MAVRTRKRFIASSKVWVYCPHLFRSAAAFKQTDPPDLAVSFFEMRGLLPPRRKRFTNNNNYARN